MSEQCMIDNPLTPVNSEVTVLGSMLLERDCIGAVRRSCRMDRDSLWPSTGSCTMNRWLGTA